MFSADPHVLEFIKGNLLSLSMFLALLKGLAVLTKSVHDDKVVTLIQRILRMGNPGTTRGVKAEDFSTVTADRPLGE